MPRVIISAGHTSQSPGTVANGLKEFEVSRKIAKAIVPHLRRNGVISLSVPPDLDLFKRLEWINNTGYEANLDDVAVEIHCNDGGKTGIEGWHEGEGENESYYLTTAILDEASKETNLEDLGARSEYDHELSSIAFLHEANPTTALVECGFLDNEKDAEFLKDDKNIEKLGKGIARGILKYLGIEYKEATNTNPQVQATQTNDDKQTKAVPKPPTRKLPQPTTNSNNLPVAAPNTNLAQAATGVSDNNNPGSMPAPSRSSFGGGGASGGFTPPGSSFGGGGSALGGGNMPSREDRKKMITDNYVKILGREPNQNDLNYFLNIGIKEEELVQKMLESQEHADLVKARQDVIETKKKFNEQQAELMGLRNQVSDQEKIISNLQESIQHKNYTLAQTQHKMRALIYEQKTTKKPGQAQTSSTNDQLNENFKPSFLDRVFKAFSDIFE